MPGPTRRDLLIQIGGACAPGLFLSACGDGGLEQLAAGPVARVAHVMNGDSLRLDNGQVVRLVGVEAPLRDQPFAPEAGAALYDLVAGQTVQLFFGGARQDHYGRILAHVRLGRAGGWVQKALLERGAARVRTYADNRALARPMLDAEARARRAGRGLWALQAYRVRLPVECAADPFGFQIVEGRVDHVVAGQGGLALDLEHWVNVETEASAAKGLAAAGVTAGTLGGQLIRVRGVARPGPGGAAVAIDHPEQIERLRA